LLRQAFDGLGDDVDRMLDETDRAEGFYFVAITQLQLPIWSRGRVTLVGDAGYCPGPAVGGSTSLAVVGAYTVAGELAAARGDHTIAYPAYEHALADYVRRSRSFACRMATQLIPRSRLHAWAMTSGVKLVTTLPAPLLRAAASRTRRLGLHDIVTVRPYDDEGRQGGEVQ
jgi:2-polyprenyl-6-methoxyphenol hydroxylase-like FAD-dependent oxidoreductase